MPRGAFIVVEGLDRSGKTTQTELLASHLTKTGVSVERIKFPGERFPTPTIPHTAATKKVYTHITCTRD